MARDLGLTVATKPDSQEICFVEDNNYGRYIEENTNEKIQQGDFVDTRGNILGRHKGIVHYTVGQRKGLGIAFGKPMFVVELDVVRNRVVLGDESEVFSNALVAGDLNLISIDRIDEPIRVKAKVRYSAKEADAIVYPVQEGLSRVLFDAPQRAITPGQAVVFYNGETVVGGGIIEEPLRV
jgi:tRNA-specific 2-thiouridylase